MHAHDLLYIILLHTRDNRNPISISISLYVYRTCCTLAYIRSKREETTDKGGTLCRMETGKGPPIPTKTEPMLPSVVSGTTNQNHCCLEYPYLPTNLLVPSLSLLWVLYTFVISCYKISYNPNT